MPVSNRYYLSFIASIQLKYPACTLSYCEFPVDIGASPVRLMEDPLWSVYSVNTGVCFIGNLALIFLGQLAMENAKQWNIIIVICRQNKMQENIYRQHQKHDSENISLRVAVKRNNNSTGHTVFFSGNEFIV